MKTTITVIVTIIVEIIIFIAFIFSGSYNISALHPDPGIVQWVFGTTSDRSVERHAKNIKMPNLDDSTMVAEGFHHYNEMCVGCHGAPGVKRGEGGQGLFPKPPNLTHSAKEMPPKELFWIVKNGIKSTGMPAFGKTHSDQKINDIVAFLEKMKTMSPQQYAQMKKQAGKNHDGDAD